jgi:hypothetical protein
MQDLNSFIQEITTSAYFDPKSNIKTLTALNERLKNSGVDIGWYTNKFIELCMYDGDITTVDQGRLTYAYLVQECLKFYDNPLDYSDTIDLVDLFAIAITKAQQLINTYPWISMSNETTTEGNEDNTSNTRILGTPKKKHKVSKLDAAIELRKTNMEMKRKEFIDLLKNELDMTSAGAATYWYNINAQLQRETMVNV